MPTLCFKRWSRKGYAVFTSLHKVVKIGVVTFTCTLTQVSYHTVFAQVDHTNQPVDDISLDEVEVTAGQPLPWTATSLAVNTLTPSDIAAAPALSLDALLDQVPGVDIRQRGPDGVQADISLNGGTFDQVLILVNGINITDPQTGHYNLDLPIELWQVRRVEVLRGAVAGLLGVHAFSGAINLITTEPTRSHGWKTVVQSGLGSWQRRSLGAQLGHRSEHIGFQVGVNYKSSAGYRPNTDYEQLNIHLQSEFLHETLGQWLLQVGYQQKAFGANQFYSLAYPQQFEATGTLFGALSWQKATRHQHWQAHLYNRYHHDRFELFRDFRGAADWYGSHNYHLTRVTGGRLSLTHHWEKHLTVLGLDVRNEHIQSNVLGEPIQHPRPDPIDQEGVFTHAKTRWTTSLTANHRWRIDHTLLRGGLAFNATSGRGWHWNGDAEIVHRFNPNRTLSLSLNRAVRLPTFTDLYYKSATQMANPNLKPEKAVTAALKLEQRIDRIDLRAHAWHRLGSHQIDWVRHPDSIRWYSRNLTQILATGGLVEAVWHATLGPITRLSADYAYQQLNKDAEGMDSMYALDYLKHKLQVKASARLATLRRDSHIDLHLTGAWHDRAGTFADPGTGGLIAYHPYWLCDGRLAWDQRNMSLLLDVNNVLNADHTDFGGMRQPGRHISLTLRFTVVE